MPGGVWAFSGVGACVRAVCGLGQVWSPAVPAVSQSAAQAPAPRLSGGAREEEGCRPFGQGCRRALVLAGFVSVAAVPSAARGPAARRDGLPVPHACASQRFAVLRGRAADRRTGLQPGKNGRLRRCGFLLRRHAPVRGGHQGEDSVVQSMAPQLTTIAFATAIAALVNVLVRLSSERLTSAHEVAEAAQRAVLPTPSKHVAGLRVAARYQAAQREALIGGDLYGARSTPHGIRLVMGDVRGKGMAAIETVSVVLGAFREASEQEETLSGVARRLEGALVRDRTDRDNTDEETFVTCVLVEIPTGHQVVRILNCGHPAPLLLGGDGSVTPSCPARSGCHWACSNSPRHPAGTTPGSSPGQHTAPVHRRPLRSPGRDRNLLRPGSQADRPDIPDPRPTAQHPRRRRTELQPRAHRRRHGPARHTPPHTDPGHAITQRTGLHRPRPLTSHRAGVAGRTLLRCITR